MQAALSLGVVRPCSGQNVSWNQNSQQIFGCLSYDVHLIMVESTQLSTELWIWDLLHCKIYGRYPFLLFYNPASKFKPESKLIFPTLYHIQKLRKRETKAVLHKFVESVQGSLKFFESSIRSKKTKWRRFKSKTFKILDNIYICQYPRFPEALFPYISYIFLFFLFVYILLISAYLLKELSSLNSIAPSQTSSHQRSMTRILASLT